MNAFVKNLIEHGDTFRIVAYRRSTEQTKSPVDWLKDEISRRKGADEASRIITECIKVVTSQPSPNSTTVYLIDEEVILYNHVRDGQVARYYALDLPRSIIPRFIQQGILQLFAVN